MAGVEAFDVPRVDIDNRPLAEIVAEALNEWERRRYGADRAGR